MRCGDSAASLVGGYRCKVFDLIEDAGSPCLCRYGWATPALDFRSATTRTIRIRFRIRTSVAWCHASGGLA